MFKVRVIACLDVKDGRVVKGVNFADLRDAARSGGGRAPYDGRPDAAEALALIRDATAGAS